MGAAIAAPLAAWLGDSVLAVVEHHEKWDGSGYPKGLRGAEISEAGRIVAVADVFDVLTSVRSYKSARSAVDARTELARCAGTHFDPGVVRAFMTLSLGRLRLVISIVICPSPRGSRARGKVEHTRALDGRHAHVGARASASRSSTPGPSHAPASRCLGTVWRVRISHKVDYGVRVMTVLAEVAVETPGRPISSAALAERDGLPPGFLDDILRLLRNGGLLRSQRGGDGGWMLARPAKEITVADVIRSVDGPLASVRGVRPHELADAGEREPFVSLWVAVRASLRSVLEHVTLADLAAGTLPKRIKAMAENPDSWDDRRRDL
jgi:Rrf2 family protein